MDVRKADNPGAAQRPAGGGQAPDAGTTGGADRVYLNPRWENTKPMTTGHQPVCDCNAGGLYGVSTDYLMGLTENKITQTQNFNLCIW